MSHPNHCCSGSVTPHGHRRHLAGTYHHRFYYGGAYGGYYCCCGQTVIYEFEKEESVTDNPFKVGDQVRFAHFGDGSIHEVVAVRGDWLWLDDHAPYAPYTAYADKFVKAEEPIVAGQFWNRVGDSYLALVREVTDNHVIYEVSHRAGLFVRTHADFRKEYTR